MSADFIDIAKQSEANARLRDAAPELLEALKRQREGFESLDEEIEWDDLVDALIAKAEGK